MNKENSTEQVQHSLESSFSISTPLTALETSSGEAAVKAPGTSDPNSSPACVVKDDESLSSESLRPLPRRTLFWATSSLLA
jgi:hypothetical protein